MIADTLVCLLLVLGVAFGLSRAFADRLRLNPSETLVAGVGLSLLAAWAVAWAVFTSGCPLRAYAVLPILALVSAAAGWKGTVRILRDTPARDLMIGQLLVTGWCVGCLAFIKNHSGGAWTGDATEHWERALYFLRQWPHDQLFIDIFQLPARPPLANVLAAAFLQITKADYAHFQVIMTALASLAYLPVGLLAARFGGRFGPRVAAAIVMVNPLFVQNATYPWTKLQAALFILSGLYFFLRVRDRDGLEGRAPLACALLLGGAVVTHYSAGPYVAVLAAAWLLLGWRTHWDRGFAKTTLQAALAGACVLAPWFAWSVHEYGWGGTFLSNSTVSMGMLPGNPLVKMALNLRDSVIPPQARGFSGSLFRQTSPWGALRDQLFLIYQLNLLFALGIAGWAVTLKEAVGAAKAAPSRDRLFWAFCLGGILALSLAAYGDRDHYGIAHICLQSLVLLGLAFLAGRWRGLGTAWRRVLVIGWTLDLALGIVLQLAVEDYAIDRWLTPQRNLEQVSQTYTLVSQLNLTEKIIAHQAYFSDILTTRPVFILALLGALLCMAVLRASHNPAASESP